MARRRRIIPIAFGEKAVFKGALSKRLGLMGGRAVRSLGG
jgi:hypothetical protein